MGQTYNTITNILDGWANNIKDEFGLLDFKLKQKAERRLLICDGCSLRENNKCSKRKSGIAVVDFRYRQKEENRLKGHTYNGCGCNLSAKTKCDDCQCPLGKWESIT